MNGPTYSMTARSDEACEAAIAAVKAYGDALLMSHAPLSESARVYQLMADLIRTRRPAVAEAMDAQKLKNIKGVLHAV